MFGVRRSVLMCAVRNRLTNEIQRFVEMGYEDAGRSDVLDTRHPEGWVAINLTETPDTDPCTQAPVNWRNADSTSK